jgi:integrase/recombinase XerD
MNLDESLSKFTDFLRKQNRSLSTTTAYSKDINQLLDYLETYENVKNIESIQTQNLNNYIENIKSDKKRHYTLKTISRKINSMKTFFKYLNSCGVNKNDIANSVKHPQYKVSPPSTLTKLEYSALRDVARSNLRLYTIVEILLQTGIRIGELARISIDDINLETNNKYIKIKKYGSNPERKVDLTKQAEIALKRYLKIRPQPKQGINSLFVTKNGNTLLVRNIRTSITRALKKIGITKSTVNDIRNTFILYQLKNGMSIEVLGQIVGHRRLTSTKRYLQLIDIKPKRKTNKIISL